MTDPELIPVTVVRALAAAEGVYPEELPYSLHEHVATDAITALAAEEGVRWEVTFDVPGHEVTVDDSGRVLVDGESHAVGEELYSDGSVP